MTKEAHPVASPDLLTYAQAAELIGVKRNTIYNYVRQGKLTRADDGPKGTVAFLRKSDLLALHAQIEQWKTSRAAGAAVVDGKKRCSKCLESKPVEAFAPCKGTRSGLASWCRECTRKQGMIGYFAAWEKRRAKAREWRKNNREKTRKHRRDAYWRNLPKERAAYKDWYQRNRAKQREYERHYQRSRDAIDWGKSSPITGRRGFALVVRRDPAKGLLFRAARLDTPFGQDEVALCRFLPPLSKEGLWGVTVWTVIPQGFREIAQRVAARPSSRTPLRLKSNPTNRRTS